MPDWTKSMQQTFEYYIVDPGTWSDVSKIDTMISSKIERDLNADTLGSASFTTTETIGENYIRVYLITIQNGIRERFPIGTYLVQTPTVSYNGFHNDIDLEAYTPLVELQEKLPPFGYSITRGQNIMKLAGELTWENVRAPVVFTTNTINLQDDFVADTDETWLDFLSSFIANAKYRFDIDDLGKIMFAPEQETASLQPIWTFDDSNSSILYPEIDLDRDLYGVPNVVEILYSNGSGHYYGLALNEDENSPTSIQSRGRKIVYRETDPDVAGSLTEEQVQAYAEKVLKEKSTIEYTITYKHGYCPVRIGDCVRINYRRAGLVNVKAKVIKQSITCEPGCPVSETAVFTNKLWR